MDLTTRVSLVQNLLTTKEIPASVGAKLLDINRASNYYKGTPVSDEELACKESVDHLHADNPTWGARQMSAQLKARGYHIGHRKTRRCMNEMDIYPIYPKMNLSNIYLFSSMTAAFLGVAIYWTDSLFGGEVSIGILNCYDMLSVTEDMIIQKYIWIMLAAVVLYIVGYICNMQKQKFV